MESLIWTSILVCCVVFLCAAVVLWCFPKRVVTSMEYVPSALRSTMLPRHLLNDFGNLVHTVFWLSAVAMVVLVVIGSIVEFS